MGEPRLNNRSYLWAPKALAVISCALALLAAQPAAANDARIQKTRAIVMREGGAARVGDVQLLAEVPRVAQERRTSGARGVTLFESARRLHILATVEILQRLLVRELQPVTHNAMAALWFEAEFMGVRVQEMPSGEVAGRMIESDSSPPKNERAFAIAHQLLAPPVS